MFHDDHVPPYWATAVAALAEPAIDPVSTRPRRWAITFLISHVAPTQCAARW
eukprot:COSAG02_NODE_42909_length_380_cov_0.551601_1_plen_51_part_01